MHPVKLLMTHDFCSHVHAQLYVGQAGSAPHDCISSEHFGSWLGVGLIWFEGSGCDCLLMQAASLLDGFSFDLFPPFVGSATCRRKAMTPYALHRRTMAIPILLGMVGAGSS